MSRQTSNGIGLFGIIQIVLIILKLTGLIDWSWKIVFLPMEIEIGLWILAVGYLFIKDLLEKIFGW